MADKLIYGFVVSAVLSVVFGLIFIPIIRKLKLGQPILSYLSEHFGKSGTPTMGGLFFVLSATIAFFVFSFGSRSVSIVSVIIVLSYMIVGFLDDFIKIKFCKNEGLTPFQKIAFQFTVAVISAVFAYKMGLTKVYIPFTHKLINLSYWSIPLSVFIFLATTNCVNLTDGLDGLAATTTKYALILTAALIFLQINKNSLFYVNEGEYKNLALFSVCIGGGLQGFLLFNTFRASIFMGDTGSLALGGAFASIMIFSGNALYIPIFGITFVLSGISVILQVVYFKRTGKRIFLMAPFHHHLQHKGLSENKITFIYGSVTLIIGLLSLLIYA